MTAFRFVCVTLLAASCGGRCLAQNSPRPATAAATPIPEALRKEAQVFLTDGRRLTGIFVSEEPDGVTLLINGIETKIGREFVDRVKVLPTIVEQYRSLKSSIDPKNVPARLELVRWLISKECYDTALFEVNAVLAAEPGEADAADLKTLISTQLRLKEKAAERAAENDPSDPKQANADPTSKPRAKRKFPLLTRDDVNTIRVYELDLKDPPRMAISRDTITRFLDKYAGREGVPITRESRDAFARKPVTDIVAALFKQRARDLYQEIKVIENPKSLKVFRDEVHRTWLANACGTTQCHGGEEAGRFQLATRVPASEFTEYTDFLILTRFQLADGSPLMNFDTPSRSPLLQFGLPPGEALLRHPTVDGGAVHGKAGGQWRPAFNGIEDQRFADAVRWIESLYKPRPTYPVHYDLPNPPNSALVPDDPDPLANQPSPVKPKPGR